MSAQILMFDRMYATTDDPWGYQVRWYEERKRNALLASLTRRSYDNVLEVGCGNGETSIALSPRAQQLLALDASARAVSLATKKLAGHPHVDVRQAVLPAEWPDGQFDLVVVSEMAYYLSDADFDDMLAKISNALNAHAEVVFCHWRHQIAGCSANGDSIHEKVRQWSIGAGLTSMLHHLEADFIIDVYADDDRSVASREGLT
jgi:cyclopropane fatty-acyl-phospholipid synthase-like methyltransferase